MSATLEARDLYRFFHAGDEETLALRGVSLRVDRGELVAVTGPSGSGKSTLLACLAGLDDPDGGTVHVAGERLSRRSEEERAQLRARSVGLLFQQENLVGHLTLAENLGVVRALDRSPRRAGALHDVLERVGLADKAHRLPRQLSGGEQARAALAVALANAPEVILADEPTGELDDATGARVLALLREQVAGGAAVLVVTHDEAVAAAADRRLRMRDGRIESG